MSIVSPFVYFSSSCTCKPWLMRSGDNHFNFHTERVDRALQLISASWEIPEVAVKPCVGNKPKQTSALCFLRCMNKSAERFAAFTFKIAVSTSAHVNDSLRGGAWHQSRFLLQLVFLTVTLKVWFCTGQPSFPYEKLTCRKVYLKVTHREIRNWLAGLLWVLLRLLEPCLW